MILAEQRWHSYRTSIIMEDILPVYTMRTMKILCENAQDITVGELLGQLEKLEKAQTERAPFAEKIIELEQKTKEWAQRVEKTQADTSDDKTRGRLQKLGRGFHMILEEIKELKTDLNDPDMSIAEVGMRVKGVFDQYKNKLMKNAKTLMTDLQLDDWSEIAEWTDEFFDKAADIPFMGTIAGMGRDVSQVFKWGMKGVNWLQKKIGGGADPEDAVDAMVDMVAQKPDTKFKTAPFFELFNIDPEYQEMLDDDLEVKFIAYYKDYLKSHADTTKLADLDIDKHLEEWIPQQAKTKDHSVTAG